MLFPAAGGGVVAVETLSGGASAVGPRIAILHATAGAGHRSAAQALAAAMSALSPDALVREVDTLVFASRFYRSTYAQSYNAMAQRAPRLWGALYALWEQQPVNRSAGPARLVFDRDTAIAYLLKQTPNADREAAGRLADALDCLPLALSHARSYCAARNWQFDSYIAKLPELIANFFYAALIRFMTVPVLIAIMAICGAGLIYGEFHFGTPATYYRGRSDEVLAAEVIEAFDFMEGRRHGEIRVQVTPPRGDSSVVLITLRDYPFLLDSTREVFRAVRREGGEVRRDHAGAVDHAGDAVGGAQRENRAGVGEDRRRYYGGKDGEGIVGEGGHGGCDQRLLRL